ncbi:RidA family protein [Paenarthrobacter nitroguajacolicus]|uniref:RidA family protein n=1 Tax=Paenarthrobacter nitroguajacolicus TaxID=211146 RepID=UPI000A7FE467|nr:Rid family hydrolase [Paenarthrobacter nitroguajacolicus]
MDEWTASFFPPAPHPFANSIANKEWILVSGMVGVDAEGKLPESASEQARLALRNIQALLEAQGSGLHEIVWMKTYVSERQFAYEIDPVLRDELPEPKPASGALVVVGLADEQMKVEFEVWARRSALLKVLG